MTISNEMAKKKVPRNFLIIYISIFFKCKIILVSAHAVGKNQKNKYIAHFNPPVSPLKWGIIEFIFRFLVTSVV